MAKTNKTEIYAAADIDTEDGFKAKRGDVIATIDGGLTLDKLLAGLQTGVLTPTKPEKKPDPPAPDATKSAAR